MSHKMSSQTFSNTELPDQISRKVFITRLNCNISLVAPAGTGKTSSIIQRIFQIATQPNAIELLPRLVVVTYTNKAADELSNRAYSLIQQHRLDAAVLQALRRARFSTIHGYCLSILEKYSHFLGIPTPRPITENELVSLLTKWEQTSNWPPQGVPENVWNCILNCFTPEVIRQAILTWPGCQPVAELAPRPEILILPQEIVRFLSCKRARSRATANMLAVIEWSKKWNKGHILPPPQISGGGQEFLKFLQDAIEPIHRWLQSALALVATNAAIQFRKWRHSRGYVTFQDQISLVLELLHHPVAGPIVTSTRPIIILDEAQDTDTTQFEVLTTLASDQCSTNADQRTLRPGAFCMVGDPQQSIYGDRASLEAYEAAEQKILSSGGLRLTLSTTFRCSRSIVEFVNRHLPIALNGEQGQVSYTPIQPHSQSSQGSIIALTVPPLRSEKNTYKFTKETLSEYQAEYLARWLAAHPPNTLGATSAEEVAILCPVKEQIVLISQALTRYDIPHTNLSPWKTNDESPAFAWLYALVHILLYPEDEFEIAGILHEIFGIVDADVYHWKILLSQPLVIHTPPSREYKHNSVAQILASLHELYVLCREHYPHDCVVKIVQCTALEQRLRLLFPDGSQNELLSRLVAHAAHYQAWGKTLREYYLFLKKLSQETAPSPTPRPGFIQLLTCHAAKGLEWDVVILPYLFTPKIITNTEGCRWVMDTTSPPRVVHSSRELEQKIQDHIVLRSRQEYQRLAYVSLTRARKTLVLVDDLMLQPLTLTPKSRSFGHLLFLHNKLSHYTEQSHPLSDQKKSSDHDLQTPKLTIDHFPDEEQIQTALSSLRNIPRRILPHAVDGQWENSVDLRINVSSEWLSDDPTEQHLTSTQLQPAGLVDTSFDLPLRYGLWWHQLMQKIPWLDTETAWQKTFEFFLPQSPCPDRALHEWKLFLLSNPRQYIPNDALIISVEEPFLWRPTVGGDVIEGVIDLLIQDPRHRYSIIIDWKTNTISTEQLEQLAEQYRSQLTYYRDAVCALTGRSASAWLYSTATGLWYQY